MIEVTANSCAYDKNNRMELITNSVVRDRWRHTRVPPNGAEMQSTSILRVKIAGGSAKSKQLTHSWKLFGPSYLARFGEHISLSGGVLSPRTWFFLIKKSPRIITGLPKKR